MTALGRALPLAFLLIWVLGCDSPGRQKTIPADQLLVDSLKVRFPGQAFSSVTLHSVAAWKGERIFQLEDLWDASGTLAKEIGSQGLALIPAHIADVNVAMWHQRPAEGLEPTSCRSVKSFVLIYRDRAENPIAGIIFDLDCLELRTWPLSDLTLNEKGWERLEMMTKEVLRKPIN